MPPRWSTTRSTASFTAHGSVTYHMRPRTRSAARPAARPRRRRHRATPSAPPAGREPARSESDATGAAGDDHRAAPHVVMRSSHRSTPPQHREPYLGRGAVTPGSEGAGGCDAPGHPTRVEGAACGGPMKVSHRYRARRRFDAPRVRARRSRAVVAQVMSSCLASRTGLWPQYVGLQAVRGTRRGHLRHLRTE